MTYADVIFDGRDPRGARKARNELVHPPNRTRVFGANHSALTGHVTTQAPNQKIPSPRRPRALLTLQSRVP
jgi:hypothetical protein